MLTHLRTCSLHILTRVLLFVDLVSYSYVHKISLDVFSLVCRSPFLYPAHVQDAPQEIEGREATAELLAWLGSAKLPLRFSPFPVGHPAHEHGISLAPSKNRISPSRIMMKDAQPCRTFLLQFISQRTMGWLRRMEVLYNMVVTQSGDFSEEGSPKMKGSAEIIPLEWFDP